MAPSDYLLDPRFTDPRRLKRERERARELKRSGWWKSRVAGGLCHYCRDRFAPAELTMDHIVPLARGGESVRANVVPACRACNAGKRLDTPVDQIFAELERERAAAAPGDESSGDESD